MYGVPWRVALICVVSATVVSFTGCGLRVRNITLIENIEVPTLQTLGEEAEPGWIEYLAGQDYELNEQFCDLNKFQDEIEALLPEFLARRIRVRSLRIVSIKFVAQEGNFNSIEELDTIMTVDGVHYMFSSGVRLGGLGRGITLRPKPRLNLADAVNNNSCVNTYLRISGTLPEEPLRFDVVLNYRLRLGFSLF